MSPLVQLTDVDHGGGVCEEVTADHVGSPERLQAILEMVLFKIEESLPNGSNVPSSSNCRLAYARTQEAISTSYHQSLLYRLCHVRFFVIAHGDLLHK